MQGIVAARLDALSPEDKALIQDAAVLGKVFWSGALAAMTGLQRWTVEESLHRLERKEFVRRERRSSVATETEYVFRHVLVRDVAYGQVPRAERAEKHRRAAEWIEALSTDREDRAEMLAHHYLSALEFARAAGQDVELARRPRSSRSARGGRPRLRPQRLGSGGAASIEEALELWPADDPDRGMLLFRYGQVVSLHDASEVGVAILEEARDVFLASDAREQAAMAEVSLVDAHWFSGAPEKARAHLQRAEELIEGASASRPKAFVLSQISRFAMLSDEDARAVEVGARDARDGRRGRRFERAAGAGAQHHRHLSDEARRPQRAQGARTLHRDHAAGLLRAPARLHQSRLDAERARRAPAQLPGA